MIKQPASDESEDMPEPAANGGTTIPVAGIGGSAGGLEVFKHLLADLPADTGLAIVFVQHLEPKHHSLLSEILSRSTAMPVSDAADRMPVEANHVYVIPANSDLTIAQGVLRLAPRTQEPGPHMPIDRFLRSLADECGSRAIGVILSGAGTDGSAGIQAIKAAGGVTFAQEQSTAKFASMPQSAVATRCVDFVLPPERIAAELVRMGRHPYMADSSPAEQAPVDDSDEAQFAAILASVHGATGIDFSLYREKTIKRRILRRLALRNMDSLAEYARRLEHDAVELSALQGDLLISVTSFFRHPGSFESLKNLVYPRLLQGRPARAPIRIWVPGCATGEEAYSIAISLAEYLSQTGASFPVQIFGSDISGQAIEKARAGRYLENIVADISAERLNRYFTKTEGRYQINKDLREMCVFTRHNLLTDPPFSKLDLVSCRNVLIYLSSVQKNIIPLFHYALRSNGFLMLGPSETAAFADLFSLVDPEHRIYAKLETARKPYPFRAGSGAAFAGAGGGGGGGGGNRRGAAGGIVERCRRAPGGGSHSALQVQPRLRGGGRRVGGVGDPRQGQYFSLPAGGQSELQSPQADPGDQSVPGSGKVGPPGAAIWRACAPGAHPVRPRRALRRGDRRGGAAARQAEELAADPFRTRARRARGGSSGRALPGRWTGRP